MNRQDLTGRVAVVTGASSGIGQWAAIALAECGARVVVNYHRNREGGEATCQQIAAAGGNAILVQADVSRKKSAEELMETTEDRLGPIDILVNNAGATWGAPAEDHPVEAWDKVMNLNVRGYFILSQEVAKQSFIPRGKGRILNVASIAGLAGNPSEMKTIAYNTSKGAVINFTRALAGEWGEHGITVNAICPGFFPSKMTHGLLEKLGADKMAQGAPLRRLGDDEDLKGLVVLYASDAGKHITGQWMAVDGGVSAIIGG